MNKTDYVTDSTDYESDSDIGRTPERGTSVGVRGFSGETTKEFRRMNATSLPVHANVPNQITQPIMQKKYKPADLTNSTGSINRPKINPNKWVVGLGGIGKKNGAKSVKRHNLHKSKLNTKKRSRLRKTHKNTKRPKYIKKNVTKRRR